MSLCQGSTSSLILPEDAIIIVQGTSRTLRVTVTDNDDVAVDITGGTIYFSVKQDIEDTEPLIQKISTNPAEAVITSSCGGEAEIYLKPADTQNLQPKVDYVFDVWLVTASGDRYDVLPPTMFKVKPSVTRIPV